MNRTLIALAVAASAALPALAQQADYCSPSGYVEGVTNGRDFDHKSCDTRAVPRVNGVPQQAPAATARPGYNSPRVQEQQQAQRYYNEQQQRYYNDRQRYYDEQQRRYYDNRGYDPRYMGNNSRDWEQYREGRYHYGARGPEWRRGAPIPREYMARQYWVEDWRAHHLYAPPRGYQWVQVGNDYVLVALTTGIIAQLLLAQ